MFAIENLHARAMLGWAEHDASSTAAAIEIARETGSPLPPRFVGHPIVG